MASAPRRASPGTGTLPVLLVPLLATLLSVLLAPGAATPVRFDQRQNGSVNVQVDLKDLEVFAIMEDEQLEGAMVQAVESVRPGLLEAQESVKGSPLGPAPPSLSDIAAPATVAAPPPPQVGTHGSGAATSANAPRRPNDKLAAIKHKTGGLLPHERSDAAPIDLPPWETAAARGEEVSSGSQEDEEEDLEPRSTTAVEARAAPAPPVASSAAAPPSPPRPTQSQGVRPAGTVSVAHLHCGLGYYRDQTGRCRRARRPSSSNTRKHHHNNRRHRPPPGAKPALTTAAAAPTTAAAPVEPAKDHPVKDPVNVKTVVTKDASLKTSALKDPVVAKESVKEATPVSTTSVQRDPAPVSPADPPTTAPITAKTAGKETVKEAVKQTTKHEVAKEHVSAHKTQPSKPVPAKAAAPKLPVQDRLSSSSHKASSTVNGNVSVKEAVKLQPVPLKSPPKPPVRESPAAKPLRQAARPAAAVAVAAVAAKDKEVPKVSHHHGQHKITVIKEDTKPRSPVAAPSKAAVKPAAPAPAAAVPAAASATPLKKN